MARHITVKPKDGVMSVRCGRTKPRWLVTLTRLYYPEIRYFDSEEAAFEYADSIYENKGEERGNHGIQLTVSKEINTRIFFTHY
jgi:hypothetical protein